MTSPLMLELQAVTYRWSTTSKAFGPITSSAPPGQFIGLIGPNGAGKSTLLKLIAAFWARESGTIRVQGRDISDFKASERARRVAFVPQTLDTQFDLTVREVVELGRLSQLSWRERLQFKGTGKTARLEEILITTGLDHLEHRPYNTLSGGEAKRALLAAALVQEAPLLLLDEPTAHLDPGHAMKFLELVRNMVDHKQTTVVMAYHDLATVGLYVDMLWVMDQGQLVLTGTPEEVLTNPLIRSIYDTDLIEVRHPRTQRPMLLFP